MTKQASVMGMTFTIANQAGVPLQQLGPTCGIYALHNAVTFLGILDATPPRKLQKPGVSIRQLAKDADSAAFPGNKMSYVGEIFATEDMLELAEKLNERLKAGSSKELFETWLVSSGKDAQTLFGRLKAAIDLGSVLVFPIAVDPDDGMPKANTDAQHWIVILGYEEGSYRLLCYDSNKQAVDVRELKALFEANGQMKAFPASWWVKLVPRLFASAAQMGGPSYPEVFSSVFNTFAAMTGPQAKATLDGVVDNNEGTAALDKLKAWPLGAQSKAPAAFDELDPAKLGLLNKWLSDTKIENALTGADALLSVNHLPRRSSDTHLAGRFIEIKPA
ncbi:hypothetical protein SAMN06265365_101638 [Tistlia consotensis]|uniref:Uncharacterized protein n=1 Tax=Tistlia consotensis USBA 355 TaxID=560819 RepID=A0A1Y6B7C5_9PROT|nr:hypothetical protein [Tistlia consotensis]SME94036.1 hypothetical protein SAMN05428998_101637 [Tistlia consotensis USBA 355]SNR29007.1 hypothetical protein SAMN06265365_101638 [Tistlia consotensis]